MAKSGVRAALAKVAGGSGQSPEGLRQRLIDRMRALRREVGGNPLENPMQRLAHELAVELHEGTLTVEALDALVALLTVNGYAHRAERMGRYLAPRAPEENVSALARVVDRLAVPVEGGGPVPFAEFQGRLERAAFGIVVTAHPTFGLTEDLYRRLAELAADRDGDGAALSEADREAHLRVARETAHGPTDGLTLLVEQDQSLAAIANLQTAVRRFYGIVLERAARHYPDQWTTLRPRPLTVASWVGYDLDGRADIKWTDTLRARMKVAALQIDRYGDRLRAIVGAMTAEGRLGPSLDPILRLVESRLLLAARTLTEEIGSLPDDPEDGDAVAAFNRRLAESRDTRLTSARALADLLGQAITLATDGQDRRALAVLRAEMETYGLGMAHTHLRLNASQLINAVRKQVGLESAPDDLGYRRRYLTQLNDMLEQVEAQEISFGSIMTEPTSARRMVMLVAQMVKYVDADEPVRILIAECESAFVVLAALYLAKLFGVDDRVDISPLFETPEALEHGHDLIAELLRNPHYRAYVRARGRLSVQTGYSDGGRYMGQTAASLAIERLRMKIAPMLSPSGPHGDELAGVELLVFDTHGESIGRGAHPGSFRDRIAYVSPPKARERLASCRVPVKQEVSFQGGDGYLFFGTPDLAFATLTRLAEAVLSDPDPKSLDDPFYRDSDWALEFFITVKRFNERLMDDPDYAALLSAFGTNLLPPTGSRMVKRQHEARSLVDQGHPSQMRAIPHNAILQQLGLLSTSVSGLGRAIAKDRDRFADLWRGSDRLRRLTALVMEAYDRSSLDVFGAYAKIFDPLDWLRRAYVETDPQRRDQMQRLARLLGETGRSERLKRVVRLMIQDAIDFNTGMEAVDETAMHARPIEEIHPDLALLHVIRITLIEDIFLLVTRIPRFSTQPDVTIEEVVSELLQLDVPRALEALRRAFPAAAPAQDLEAFGEPATYETAGQQSYAEENRALFDPIEQRFALIRRISAGVTHVVGAVG